MADLFSKFIEFIKDRTTSWGFKTALFIAFVAAVFATDYFVGFSYNYHINNKISQLEKINTLKNKYRTDSLALTRLTLMEQKIFVKIHYSDKLSTLFENTGIEKVSWELKQNKETNEKTASRSLFWMALTSNLLFVFIVPFLFFIPLYSKDGRKGSTIAGWLASLILVAFIITSVTWISYQIPLIDNNPVWNYILNVITHILIIIGISQIGKNKDKE